MASKKKQRKWMRDALYDAYQMAGALGAGEKALDNFYAAASGKKPPHDDVLPLFIPLWETEMQTHIVHLQEKLLETDADLLYVTDPGAVSELHGVRRAKGQRRRIGNEHGNASSPMVSCSTMSTNNFIGTPGIT